MSCSELFPYSSSEKENILRLYGTTKEQVIKDVQYLQEWLKSCKYLPAVPPHDTFIEHMLLQNKYRVEKTKKKLDRYFTGLGTNSDFYTVFANGTFVYPVDSSVMILPLPQLGPDLQRYFVMTMKVPADVDRYDFAHYLQMFIVTVELCLRHDESGGFQFICDMQNYTFAHLRKADPWTVLRLNQHILDAYAGRFVGVEILYSAPALQILWQMLKTILKPKFIERINFHSNLESLHAKVPVEYLPLDLGGTNPEIGTYEDIVCKVDRSFRESLPHFTNLWKFKANEEVRLSLKDSTSNNGNSMDGTFRQLSID